MNIRSHAFKIFTAILLMMLSFSSSGQSSIPFTMDGDSHILVTATINGVPAKFIFDTGAGMTVISQPYAKKIKGLKKQDADFTGFRETGERLRLDLYKGESLALGSFIEKDPVVAVFDGEFGPIDGLISLKSFASQPFTIDFEKKQLIIETSANIKSIEKTGKVIPLQMDIQRDKTLDIFAYFRVNDKRTLQLSIDGGAAHNVFFIDTKFLIPLGIDTATAKKRYKPSEFDSTIKVTMYTAPLQSIAAASQPGININNVRASFIPGLIYDGKVSLDWMGKIISFDLEKKEMIIQQ